MNHLSNKSKLTKNIGQTWKEMLFFFSTDIWFRCFWIESKFITAWNATNHAWRKKRHWMNRKTVLSVLFCTICFVLELQETGSDIGIVRGACYCQFCWMKMYPL